MKVLLINGSPRKNGCTSVALAEVAKSLESHGIATEAAWIGNDPVRGCQACRTCAQKGARRCVFDDDVVNRLIEKAEAADGIIIGSPVYYAGVNGALIAALDRMFYAGGAAFAFKPAAGIASARRAGTTPTIDQLNKYFLISRMPIVPSNYWPMVHGSLPEDVTQDAEGLQIMRVLGQNMAWMLHCIEAGRAAGIEAPQTEQKVFTNFIRPLS
ncbi:MAG: flavodoxin family protein [Coriobacteriaceae bacterium]|nr:flavodoxin family protein [Coriobacteriaceae bacterium]